MRIEPTPERLVDAGPVDVFRTRPGLHSRQVVKKPGFVKRLLMEVFKAAVRYLQKQLFGKKGAPNATNPKPGDSSDIRKWLRRNTPHR